MAKRVFLIVLDSFGVGELPDAAEFGDVGSNTLRSCYNTGKLNVPNMQSLGLFNIDGVDFGEKAEAPRGFFGRLSEKSVGKDTTTGHWELAGIVSSKPFPTFPDGFPEDLIKRFERVTGRKVLCNKPYSGTKVIADYGREHMETGALIVYTSADSVFQIAAHESVVPVEKLYEYCRLARELLVDDYAVGRVIARPFEGEYPFTRTPRRHDFSLVPPRDTIFDIISRKGKTAHGIGKIYDIFAGKGLTGADREIGNAVDMQLTSAMQQRDFNGLCFTNLVDFDMSYGHRRDPEGYANALNEFDSWLGGFMQKMQPDDALIITADHGCDPCHTGTDHTREYIPVMMYGDSIAAKNFGTREGFSRVGATVLDLLGEICYLDGISLFKDF
ncbi:MAG: phosphopentomutase [Oscillospiraceae bacterium]